MRSYGNFVFDHPGIAVAIIVVMIVMVYVFSRQLKPQELKKFSLFMGIGIAALLFLFLIAMFFPPVVKYYPYVILCITIITFMVLYQKFKT